jgi:hypothetical protein
VESPILRRGGSAAGASHAVRRQKPAGEERPRLFRGVLIVPTNDLLLEHIRGFLLWTLRVGSLEEEEGWCVAFPTAVVS